ncbi:hypothetical protein CF122_20075 [Aeromonas media]|nr:hypothetical protein CF122_20075 [Aeromonas media]
MQAKLASQVIDPLSKPWTAYDGFHINFFNYFSNVRSRIQYLVKVARLSFYMNIVRHMQFRIDYSLIFPLGLFSRSETIPLERIIYISNNIFREKTNEPTNVFIKLSYS